MPGAPKVTATTTDDNRSDLEVMFDQLFAVHCPDLPTPETECELIEGRNFRCDRTWREARLVVEIEGLGHEKTNMYRRDVTKYNLLALQGWRLLRCTRRMLTNDPLAFFALIREGLAKGEEFNGNQT